MEFESEHRDPELDAIEAKVLRERDELLTERSRLMSMRQELLARLRVTDRRLADCRATARFFNLKIDFPDEESEQIDRIERERIERERAIRIVERNLATRRAEQAAIEAKRETQMSFHRAMTALADETKTKAQEPVHHNLELEPARFQFEASAIATASAQARSPRPTLREAVLNRLAAVGDKGVKAAPIREWFETTFGEQIHEKTVGMTLYRLQKEGRVRRDGHIWFLAPPKAETENPGGETPGPINSEQQ
jgi:hypothetical protein